MNSRLGNYMTDEGFYKASNMFIGVDMCDAGQVLARQKFFIDKVHGYVKNNHCFLDAKVWEFVKSKKCHVEYYLFNQFYTFGALNKNAVGFLVDSENGIYASVVRCENFQKLPLYFFNEGKRPKYNDFDCESDSQFFIISETLLPWQSGNKIKFYMVDATESTERYILMEKV